MKQIALLIALTISTPVMAQEQHRSYEEYERVLDYSFTKNPVFFEREYENCEEDTQDGSGEVLCDYRRPLEIVTGAPANASNAWFDANGQLIQSFSSYEGAGCDKIFQGLSKRMKPRSVFGRPGSTTFGTHFLYKKSVSKCSVIFYSQPQL